MGPYRDGRRNIHELTSGIVAYFPPYLARASLANWSYPNKPLYCVGPLLPSLETVKTAKEEAIPWLEKAVKEYGERSVAYVSFGSLFFVPTASQIPILVSALAKRGKPCLFVAGNIPSDLREILETAAEENGKGLVMVIEWVTQHAVLNHPAVGWFLTHGGQGACSEAIFAGVPMGRS